MDKVVDQGEVIMSNVAIEVIVRTPTDSMTNIMNHRSNHVTQMENVF